MSTHETHPDTQPKSDREYERVTRSEFERGLAEIAVDEDVTFAPKDYDWSAECIYEAVVDDDFEDGVLFVRVYSSLYRGEARDSGRDSIKTVGMYRPHDGERAYPVAIPETEYTKRLPTWQSNIHPDIVEVKETMENRDFKRCEACGALLARREVDGTYIWGCIAYPHCQHTESYDDNPACPDCEQAMIKRENGNDGSKFWGCIQFPDCRGNRNIEG